MPTRVSRCVLVAAVVAATVSGCTSDSTPLTGTITTAVTPTAVLKDTGDAQTAAVGKAVLIAPRVHILNAQQMGVSGLTVRFSTSDSTALLQTPTATTDANGFASAGIWQLGQRAGLQQVIATVTGYPAIAFTATATAGDPAQLVVIQGSTQTAPLGTPLPVPPAVKLVDTYGNPTAGHLITFAVATGGGRVFGDTVRTNALGIASPGLWLLGPNAGTQTLVVTSDAGVNPTRVFATATSLAQAAAARMILLAGANQVAAAGRQTATAPIVQVNDSAGAPIVGQMVTFSITQGAGTLGTTVTYTDRNGLASAGSWTLDQRPGANTVQVSSPSLAALTVTATGIIGPPAAVVLVSGSGQVGKINAALSTPLMLRVTDAFGNPVSGVVTIFALTAGGGTLNSGLTMTDANGLAASGIWTVGPIVGPASAQGVAASLTPVLFTATIIP